MESGKFPKHDDGTAAEIGVIVELYEGTPLAGTVGLRSCLMRMMSLRCAAVYLSLMMSLKVSFSALVQYSQNESAMPMNRTHSMCGLLAMYVRQAKRGMDVRRS